MDTPVFTCAAAQLLAEDGPRASLLSRGRHLALRVSGFLSPAECARYVAGVYAGRASWIGSFEDSQFSLGRAWYTDLELERTESYFATARRSDELVARHLPGLCERLLDGLGRFVGAPVRRRPGWCGPGVHIFPAGEWVSRHGGEVHFDIEGIPEPERELPLSCRAPGVTAVLVLQPALLGGGLRVWDLRYEGEDFPSAPPGPAHVPSAVVPYEAGDLVLFDSYRLHQIQPFSGPADRISATVHALFSPKAPGAGWEAWF